jgi:hypothetical protein
MRFRAYFNPRTTNEKAGISRLFHFFVKIQRRDTSGPAWLAK